MERIEILVKGHIDVSWSDWLTSLSINHTDDGNTLIEGNIRDQSTLYGVLGRLSDLGIKLISVSHGGQDMQ
jgi:hypothetical protein